MIEDVTLTHYDELYGRALARHGEAALEARLPRPDRPVAELPDDRILAMMARVVFAAGFRWKVIDAKWPGFEAAFAGFRPDVVASLSEDEQRELAEDRRIVRNPQKIRATIANAHLVVETAAEHGSFGAFLAEWPADDVVGLWAWLKKRGSRLGGDSGPRVLRHVGVDTFILTQDVTRCLTDLGVLTAKPGSLKQQRRAQAAFLAWQAQSGRSLAELSVIAACSVPS